MQADPGSQVAPAVPIRPAPMASHRPWAGGRLGPDGVGELWLAGPDSQADVPSLGRLTLDELARAAGEAFVGARALALLGPRFPLLVKLIDAGDWLSLQVHPSDAIAADLYGAGSLGKTEAWLVVDADPDTRLVTGLQRDLAAVDLRSAIATGGLSREQCEDHPARPGETWLVPAGTVHAIGAGAFVYEIEQPSDLTFRISDWGRPVSSGRPLHTAEALQAVRPAAHAVAVGRDWQVDGGTLDVPEFRLELEVGPSATTRRPAGRSLEVVTAIRGRAQLAGDGWTEVLDPFDTLVLPAAVAVYSLDVPADGLVCIGSVP